MLFVITASVNAQVSEVTERINTFHRLLSENKIEIADMLHEDLSYGHSNGCVENKNQLLGNLGGYMKYQSFHVDSMNVVVTENTAYSRFIATIDVTMNGKIGVYKLRVLEVWVRTGTNWKLLARQAVKHS